ncbi:cyclin, putative [Plasmodium berghei]|uniref:Cyclin n=2 Tax=Plasmodium berghei TaxID=5821 RepID=A0A509ANU8_PLABA|nr:cyclin [Plasmodium berghei ANKA]CXI80946.1 cyclin, putative [Plasmodium berghei]SCM25468.1 cyclin, putative [Plasmodium berghei]SCN27376.1 cyclin, putative [Plasmodium berghei]SCO62035.1 cyclin, putative [Plasmodium berghei]SCO63802.1 cyclin, putative [Plasmodium berghei]|eukprot:XP_034423009.1 cyclin [Plasmodium berghei ANKA]
MDYDIEINPPRTHKDYIMYIPIVLGEMIKMSKGDGKITTFHASQVPDISIKNYVERIGKYIGCSNECFVLLMIYLDRIIKIHKDITLSLLCIHRLIITAAMISAKFFDDLYYSNAFYAKVGGITTKELNKLEAHFLNLLDYKLYVSSHEYNFYRKYISIAVQKFLNRKQSKPISVVKTYNLFNYSSPNINNSMFLKNKDKNTTASTHIMEKDKNKKER